MPPLFQTMFLFPLFVLGGGGSKGGRFPFFLKAYHIRSRSSSPARLLIYISSEVVIILLWWLLELPQSRQFIVNVNRTLHLATFNLTRVFESSLSFSRLNLYQGLSKGGPKHCLFLHIMWGTGMQKNNTPNIYNHILNLVPEKKYFAENVFDKYFFNNIFLCIFRHFFWPILSDLIIFSFSLTLTKNNTFTIF